MKITGTNLDVLKRWVSNNYCLIILAILTIIAFALRYYHLDYNSLWEDEITTTIIIGQDLGSIFNRIFLDTRPTPPLFYILEHIVFQFGSGDWLLRFLPALFGSLSIPVIYFIGKELVNKYGGLIAASLLSVSVFHIFYSQEARAYSTLLFIFLLTVLFYILALKSNKISYWILFSVFAALSFWCHFYILIGIGILYLHAIITNIEKIRNNKKIVYNYLISVILFIVLVLPLVIAGLSIISTQLNPIQPGLTGFFTAPYAIYKMLTWNWNIITLGNCIIVSVYCILALIGCIYIFKRSWKTAILTGMLIILPPLLSVCLSIVFGLAVWQQYLAFVLPFILIAISGLIYAIPKKWNVKTVTVCIICLILLLSLIYLPTYYNTYTKSDWKGAYSELTNLTNDGDTVVLFSDLSDYTNPYYYYNPNIDNTNIINTVSSLNDLEDKVNNISSGDVYFIFTWDTKIKNITEIAPSGLIYLDNLIGNYYANTELGVGDPKIVNWLVENTVECATYSYFGPYRDIHICKFIERV